MSVQPVELSKAYRLLQVGSTTMISAKYDGVENVMSAAWVGLAGERKVVAYIGPQAFTRQLVEKSGYFVVQIPVVSQMATVLYAGGRSYADAPDKNDSIPFIYQPGFDIPPRGRLRGLAGVQSDALPGHSAATQSVSGRYRRRLER